MSHQNILAPTVSYGTQESLIFDLLRHGEIAGREGGTGGAKGAHAPPDFGRIRRRTCSIKRLYNTACLPTFLDLPPALITYVVHTRKTTRPE